MQSIEKPTLIDDKRAVHYNRLEHLAEVSVKASDLTRLSDVAALSSLDFQPHDTNLIYDGQSYISVYSGAYVRGVVERTSPGEGDPFSVWVNTKQFRAFAELMGREHDVRISLEGKRLLLKGQRGVVSLQGRIEQPDPGASREWHTVARIQVAPFLSEVQVAREFTAKSVAHFTPIGLKLVFKAGRVGILAADGASSVFSAKTACEVISEHEAVIQPTDLVTALQFLQCDDAEIAVVTQGEGFLLRGNDARVELSTLASPWPNLSSLGALKPVCTVQIQSSAFQDALAAAKAFETAETIHLAPDGDAFTLTVDGGEAGTFSATLAGALPYEMTFSATISSRLTKMGDSLTFELCDKVSSPVIVRADAEGRKAWLMQRV